MAFWNDAKLRKNLNSIISPPNQKQIVSNSYQLSVGEKAFITSDGTGEIPKLSIIDQKGITIPSGQFALIETKETVTVPEGSMAFISVRAKIKFRGLINVSGFHVDPGFSGKLIFSVYNAGPNPIDISQEQDIFLIWYADLSESNEVKRPEEKRNNEITSELTNNINSPVRSIQTLSTEVEKIKTWSSVYRLVGVMIGSIFVASLPFAYEIYRDFENLKVDVVIIRDNDIESRRNYEDFIKSSYILKSNVISKEIKQLEDKMEKLKGSEIAIQIEGLNQKIAEFEKEIEFLKESGKSNPEQTDL